MKGNALAGHRFSGLDTVNAHLQRWLREIADQRVHGATRMTPLSRFAEEAPYLTPLDGRPPFRAGTEVLRKVSKDCVIQWESNAYSVPWQLVGRQVRVEVAGEKVRVYDGAELHASHDRCVGRHQRQIDPSHYDGLQRATDAPDEPSTLGRSLDSYTDVGGGDF